MPERLSRAFIEGAWDALFAGINAWDRARNSRTWKAIKRRLPKRPAPIAPPEPPAPPPASNDLVQIRKKNA